MRSEVSRDYRDFKPCRFFSMKQGAMDISDQSLNDIREGRLTVQELRSETYATIKQIDQIKNPLSYEEFFRNYLLPNRPCLLDAWATESWLSREKWATDQKSPDFEHLEESFGHATVPVANCNVEQYSSHPKEDMSMSDYIKYLKEMSSKEASSETKCLYLKDWHFTREFPDYEAYKVPVYFCSDWLNESWDMGEDLSDDYRFVYIGPKGSWTPFHTDVFKSYSWSANIVGCKKWILFPPGEEKHFKDKLGNLAYDLTSNDLQDKVKYPSAFDGHRGFEVIQMPGQVLFVPSGWHHQVWNMENTISINHNWYNGCNIDLCWEYIKSCLKDVQKEISDCRGMEGWHQQCQLVLKASCGMDFAEFLQFLQLIANHRVSSITCENGGETIVQTLSNKKGVPECLCYLESDNICQTSKKYYNAYGRNHALFDLTQITNVMEDLIRTLSELEEVDFSKCAETPQDFLKRITDYK